MALHLSTYNLGTYTLTVCVRSYQTKDEKPKQINTNAEGAQ